MKGSSSLGLDKLLKLVDEENTRGTVIQVFDPDKVICTDHVLAAYLNALTAFKNKTNVSKKLGMEMLLFTAMTKQVKEAVERVGAKSSKDFIVFANSKKAIGRIEKQVKLSRVEFDGRHISSVSKTYGMHVDLRDKNSVKEQVLVKMMISRLTG